MSWIKGQIPIKALESGNGFLITDAGGYVTIVFPSFYEHCQTWCLCDETGYDSIRVEDVIAWQYLPEPYVG
jgi:hypothetical protein